MNLFANIHDADLSSIAFRDMLLPKPFGRSLELGRLLLLRTLAAELLSVSAKVLRLLRADQRAASVAEIKGVDAGSEGEPGRAREPKG